MLIRHIVICIHLNSILNLLQITVWIEIVLTTAYQYRKKCTDKENDIDTAMIMVNNSFNNWSKEINNTEKTYEFYHQRERLLY